MLNIYCYYCGRYIMHYSAIKFCDMLNGPGIRCTLFVSGCNHHCPNCFNPETHNPNYGFEFTDDVLNTIIIPELKKDYYKGFTFCGGDPLYPNNRQTVLHISKILKALFKDRDIFIYTGYTLQELNDMNDPVINDLFNYIDYLADGRFVEKLKSPDKHWVGSSNQNVYHITHLSDCNTFTII